MDADLSPTTGELLEAARGARARGDRAAALAAYMAATAQEPDCLVTRVELARELVGLDRLDDAETVLRGVLAIDPCHVGALIECAQVQRGRANREAALAHLEAAAAVEPHHLGIKVEIAYELRELDRLDEAEAILGAVRSAEPRNLSALVETGHLRRRRGDRAGSLAAFAAAAAIAPTHQGVKLELARDLCVLDRLDEAEAIHGALLNADPGDVGALVERGHVRRRRADHGGAAAAFEAAAAGAPHNHDLRIELARDLQALGRPDDAEACLRAVLTADPGHAAATAELGQLQRARGDRSGAIEAFRTAAECNPHLADPLVELAKEQWAAGLPDEARDLLRRARDLDPNHLDALTVSAEQALLAADPMTALALARHASELHADEPGPYLIGARAAAEMLDRIEAAQWLDWARTAMGPRPEIAAAQIHLCRQFRDHPAAGAVIAAAGEAAMAHFGFWLEATSLAIALGDFAAAKRALDCAPAASAQEAAEVHFLRAKLAESQRDYGQAIASCRDALAHGDASAEWHRALARCCLLLADTAGARAHLRAAISLDSGTRRARGESLNLSQNHLGQMLDEYMLDRKVADRLVAISALPPQGRIGPLVGLVRHHPDSTPAAILLALTLRQSGRLDPPFRPVAAVDATAATGVAGGPIPARIVQFWHDPVPPPDVAAIMASWRDAHPSREYVRFDNASAAVFLRAHVPGPTLQAFLRGREPAQRADIFRLAYLHCSGGFFIDADDRCLAPLEAYVPAAAEFVAYQEEYATIGVNFVGAAPGHPVIARALQLAVEAVNRGDHDMPWLSTGAGLLTRAFTQLVAKPDPSDWLGRAVVLELHELQRAVGVYCPTQYKKQRERRISAGKTGLAG